MSNIFTLDSNYLARKRKEIKDEISYARYQVNGTWYQAKLKQQQCFLMDELKQHL